jgi:hypothetical protein
MADVMPEKLRILVHHPSPDFGIIIPAESCGPYGVLPTPETQNKIAKIFSVTSSYLCASVVKKIVANLHAFDLPHSTTHDRRPRLPA